MGRSREYTPKDNALLGNPEIGTEHLHKNKRNRFPYFTVFVVSFIVYIGYIFLHNSSTISAQKKKIDNLVSRIVVLEKKIADLEEKLKQNEKNATLEYDDLNQKIRSLTIQIQQERQYMNKNRNNIERSE